MSTSLVALQHRMVKMEQRADNQREDIKVLSSEMSEVLETVAQIKIVQEQHSRTLEEHTQLLDQHTQILDRHTQILDQHTQILDQHTQILDQHSRKLDEHTEILTEQSQSLNLHTRMFEAAVTHPDIPLPTETARSN